MGLTRGTKLLIGLSVLIALIGGAYVAGQSGDSIDRFLSWLEGVGVSPSEGHKPVIFFEGDHNGGGLYELSGKTVREIKLLNSGDLIDYSRTPDHSVEAFIFRPENEQGTLVSVKKTGEANTLLGNPSTIKSGIAISPDGTHVVYAELKEPVQAMSYTPDSSQWVVRIVEVETKRSRVLGEGVAPYFIGLSPDGEAHGVLYSSFDGLVIHSLDSFEQTIFSNFRASELDRASVVSHNGRHIAVFNPITGTYALYDLYQTNPPRLSALGGLMNGYESIVMSDDTLYGLSRISGEYKLFKHSLSEPRVRGEILTFPEAGKPTRLIP